MPFGLGDEYQAMKPIREAEARRLALLEDVALAARNVFAESGCVWSTCSEDGCNRRIQQLQDALDALDGEPRP